MNRKGFLFYFSMSLLLAVNGRSQSTDLIQTPVQPAPNSAALAKFADIPVSYYTGTPQISIPLYTIQKGSANIPISISYHASGIKVGDVASWVGLGWALNYGGDISRSVRGLADEGTNGFLSIGNKIDDGTSLSDKFYLIAASDGKIDTESDVYYYNTPNGSGKFYLTYNSEIVLQDYKSITIESPFDTGNQYWKIFAEDGTQYLYGEAASGGITIGGKDLTTVSSDERTYPTTVSAWHLQRVISADRADTISFYYENEEGISYDLFTPETLIMPNYNVIDFTTQYCFSSPSYNLRSVNNFSCDQKLISKIDFGNGYVEFITSNTTRSDLEGGHTLSQINVRNKAGEILKYFVFNYGDFDPVVSRLKLLSVTEFGADGSGLPPFSFTYNEAQQMPGRDSFSQDHWGFYNANTVDKMIPKYIIKPDGTYIYYSEGGTRETDPERTLTYLLTGITYPTGGSTQFDYEAHDNSKVGHFQATEYYTETYSAHSLSTASQGPDDSETFTLTEAASVEIIINCGCVGPTETADASATLTKEDGNIVAAGYCGGTTTSDNNAGPIYKILQPGTYQLFTSATYISSTTHSAANITVNIARSRTVDGSTTPFVGGARIKSMRKYDFNNTLINTKKFEYKYLDDNGELISSGVLINNPVYYFNTIITGTVTGSDGVPTGVNCPKDNAISVPKNSLGDGTHIGYKQIKVIYGENGENGSSVFKYIAADSEPDSGGNTFPFAPADSRDNRRGRLLNQLDLNQSGDTLRQTTTKYFRSTNFLKFQRNVKVGKKKLVENDAYLISDFAAQRYMNRQEWNYSTQETNYNYSGNQELVTTTNFFYDRPQNHPYVTSKQTIQSDGSVLTQSFKYPQDYAIAGSGLNNINSLVTAHIFNPVIEDQTWKTINNVPNLIAGKVVDYEPQSFHPSQVWILETSSDLASPNNETINNGKYTALLSDNTYYKSRAQFSYQNNRLVSQSKITDVKHSYIWGYGNLYPIAEVTNSDASEIAFTSFENDSDGNWNIPSARNTSDHFTGTLSYSLSSGNLVKSGLSNTLTYKISCWMKSGGNVLVNALALSPGITVNGWTYYEKEISFITSISISGSGIIDDLKLYPANAVMKTYTYEPLRGLTSVCDENNVPAFYEYDPFGRLYRIVDYKGNIVKQVEYGYKKQ